MYIELGQNSLGNYYITEQSLSGMIQRRLPNGARCIAIRMFPDTGICLVMIRDDRKKWIAGDDQELARQIGVELKGLGISAPRLRWLHPRREVLSLEEHTNLGNHWFWSTIVTMIVAWFILPLFSFLALLSTAAISVWLAHWLLRRGGWEDLKKYIVSRYRRIFKK